MFSVSSVNPSLDENSMETRAQGQRRSKREDFQTRNNGPIAPKRAALGTITNQSQRIQPFRAAKASTNEICSDKENAFTKAAGKSAFGELQSFKIHIDQENVGIQTRQRSQVSESSEPKLELNDAITALPRVPLSTAQVDDHDISIDEKTESPMVLDTSIEERDEKADRDAIIVGVPEYAADIYAYLREAETRNRPKAGYMKKQPDITTNMRCILVDWLVEVAEEYKLHRETLFLAVNYIDRFLSHMSVLRGKLQLVGAASMFLAAKYEEIYPPDVGEFVYITDDTYSKKQVLRMEHLVLKVLSFDVAVPTINWFCERFVKQCGADEKVEALAMFLIESTLIDAETYMKFLPSTIAAAAVCLANHTFQKEAWSSQMVQETGYDIPQLSECLHQLHRTFCESPNHAQQAVQEKYRQPKFHQVSLMQPPMSLPL
ncbi:G2/mitotic-specific cyclin-A-like [Liolophura sinensis]|uniref:G2/mitotic-specific cyclin-A-like n=1 Tax=Liolophura sinensis TaxID=3198878 RepID=UPI0031585E4B